MHNSALQAPKVLLFDEKKKILLNLKKYAKEVCKNKKK